MRNEVWRTHHHSAAPPAQGVPRRGAPPRLLRPAAQKGLQPQLPHGGGGVEVGGSSGGARVRSGGLGRLRRERGRRSAVSLRALNRRRISESSSACLQCLKETQNRVEVPCRVRLIQSTRCEELTWAALLESAQMTSDMAGPSDTADMPADPTADTVVAVEGWCGDRSWCGVKRAFRW